MVSNVYLPFVTIRQKCPVEFISSSNPLNFYPNDADGLRTF